MVNEFLPIKVVLPDANRRRANLPGGTPPKLFGEVGPELREQLMLQVDRVAETLAQAFDERRGIPGVARVALKSEALAKSHRPEEFLTRTCPIIGVGTPGELFVSVTPQGLQNLRRTIQTATTRQAEANISAIRTIEAFTLEDRLRLPVEVANRPVPLKVKLFDHHDFELNERIRRDYIAYLNGLRIQVTNVSYAHDLHLLIVNTPNPDVPGELRRIAAHPGVRAASVVPTYFPLRHRALPVPGVQINFPTPVAGEDYPTVAVVDSGIDPACVPLQPWVMGTETYVARGEFDPRHGTFVAGLATFGESINGPLVANLGRPCRILDVQVIPGANGVLTENSLVAALQDVVPRYADRVKVWNLSLGSDEVCSSDTFSDLAHALDELQAANGVQFVIAAGNYQDAPRPWPPVAPLGDADRICSPADSVVALTVGSVAHAEALGSIVHLNEPSPFSRRGPGPAYVVKPEIVNYGGNCDAQWGYSSTGIRSVDQHGGIAEDIGTSFSTPLTSSLVANLVHEIQPSPSMNLARALLVHSADHRHDPNTADIEYFGFGRPQGFSAVLHASPDSATLIFEDILKPGGYYDLDPFPYPDCLMRNGTSRGTVKMTLVYTPPLNASFGMEYCRANIDAHLGTYSVNRKTGEMVFKSRVPVDPQISGAMYEEDLIKHGHKWCPVKSYRAQLSRVNSQRWRLMVDMLHRSGEVPADLPFALVITITGGAGDPVYNDVVAALRAHGIVTQDLALRSEVRQRVQGIR